MASLKTASLGLLMVTLVLLAPALTDAADKAYTFYPGVGYYLTVTTPSSNWTDAFEYCESTGGHLAVPNSDAEAEVYKQIIAATDAQYQSVVYIGFHDLFVFSDYETVLDYPLVKSGYTRWAVPPPLVQSFRCGGFSRKGGLVLFNCQYSQPSMFICEKPIWSDYEFFANLGYYKLHTDATTWTAAWQTCRKEDSHLVVINSIAEYEALQNIFARYPSIPEADFDRFAWVGVHSKFAHAKFRTVRGSSLEEAGYSTWAPEYPGVGINLRITSVMLERNNESLAMIAETNKLAFFCEHEL